MTVILTLEDGRVMVKRGVSYMDAGFGSAVVIRFFDGNDESIPRVVKVEIWTDR